MSTVLRRAALAFVATAMLATSATAATAATPTTEAAPSSGFDNWSCKPSAAHPEPLVLLHGLGGNGPGNYSFLGPYLAGKGYCAFTLTYGQASPAIPVGGTVSIVRSAAEIEAFVDRVRTATGHPIGRLAPLIDFPADFPVGEYLTNVGLILKES